MGQKDIAMRNFMRTEEVYIDFLEHFVFKNRIQLTKDMVFERKGLQSVLVNTKEKRLFFKEKARDLFFLIKENVEEHPEMRKFLSPQGELACLVIGIEGQNDLSNIMPVRIMLYDAISYENQIRESKRMHLEKRDLEKGDFLSGIHKDEKLIPVVSIVFYYGEEPWDRATTLFDMIDLQSLDSDIINMVQNYKINLVDIHDISDFDSFKSALGPIIELMKIRKDKDKIKAYICNHQEFLSDISEETFDLIAEIVDSQWLLAQKNTYIDRKGGGCDMCTGMKDWLAEIEQDGFSKGQQVGINKGISIALQIIADLRKGSSEDDIASLYGLNIDDVMMVKNSIV